MGLGNGAAYGYRPVKLFQWVEKMIDLKKSLIYAAAFPVLFVLAQVLFYSLSPTNYYFKYYSVEFERVDFENNSIVFLSDNETYRRVRYEWDDTLFCDTGHGMLFFSQNPPTTGVVDGARERKKRPWNYRGEMPKSGTTCYLKSAPTISLPLGFSKSQVILSKPFTIPPRPEN